MNMKIIVCINNDKERESIKEIFDEDKKTYEVIGRSLKFDISGFDYQRKNRWGYEAVELKWKNVQLQILMKYIDDIIIDEKE